MTSPMTVVVGIDGPHAARGNGEDSLPRLTQQGCELDQLPTGDDGRVVPGGRAFPSRRLAPLHAAERGPEPRHRPEALRTPIRAFHTLPMRRSVFCAQQREMEVNLTE